MEVSYERHSGGRVILQRLERTVPARRRPPTALWLDAGCDETLIHDERVWLENIPVERVVARKAGFIVDYQVP